MVFGHWHLPVLATSSGNETDACSQTIRIDKLLHELITFS